MSPRSAVRLAWTLWTVIVVLLIALLIAVVAQDADFDAVVVAFVIFVLAFSTVGALVASRLPRNPIGWIMSSAALAYIVGGLSLIYEDAVAHTGAIPMAGRLFIWLGSWVWSIGLGLAGIFLLLLFPSGRLPSPRWRIVAYAGIAGTTLMIAGAAFDPNWQSQGLHGTNPVGIRGAESLLMLAENLGGTLTIASVAGAAASLVLRFRRSKGVERQQLKWLAYAGAVVVCGFVAVIPVEAAVESTETVDNINNFVITQSLALVPIAAGIAILRYRLYAIDRIINKTLVFGLVTAVLVAGYAGGILLLQSLLPVPSDSAITVAGSTLAMAALFRPLRRRIQHVVDRRFYRARYDATNAIESFAASLRDETDLESLTSDLVGVVTRTMQPSHASVWLTESPQAVPGAPTSAALRAER